MRRAKKKNIRAYILWKISSLNWYVMADAVIEMVLKQKMVLTRLFCSWEESPIVCYLSHKTALKFHRCSRTLNCLCAASPEVVTLTCCIWSEFVFVCLFFFLMFFCSFSCVFGPAFWHSWLGYRNAMAIEFCFFATFSDFFKTRLYAAVYVLYA